MAVWQPADTWAPPAQPTGVQRTYTWAGVPIAEWAATYQGVTAPSSDARVWGGAVTPGLLLAPGTVGYWSREGSAGVLAAGSSAITAACPVPSDSAVRA